MNQLKNARSTYLQQHKDNPVNWYPYGDEAIKKARETGMPIFLSIGYSACHWCHVMAHESFEAQDVADYLNANYVCIKVDREELPEVDQYYQLACQIYNGRGGWPLSAFLLPDLSPFFVGTYFPHRPETIGVTQEGAAVDFLDIIKEIHKHYKENGERIHTSAQEVTRLIVEHTSGTKDVTPEAQSLPANQFPAPQSIFEALNTYADYENGGYGPAPKFPMLAFTEWGLDMMQEGAAAPEGAPDAGPQGLVPRQYGEHMIETVERMCLGGIYDHVGGGLHRYSTDSQYLVPHFEKMLYDQSGYIKVLAKASLYRPSPIILDNLFQTLQYLEGQMLSDDGFFFSAQDADSEGQEGLYFTFTQEEFREAIKANPDTNQLNDEDIAVLEKWMDITPQGNFEHNLNVISLNPKYRNEFLVPEKWHAIRLVRRALGLSRSVRIPPQTDTKGVASWNFMLLSALVDVWQYAPLPEIKKSAQDLFLKAYPTVLKTFIESAAWEKSGLLKAKPTGAFLKHTTSRSESSLYFEDIATLSELFLRAHEMLGKAEDLENLKTTLSLAHSLFFKDGRFHTQAFEPQGAFKSPHNLPLDLFDHSYKSGLGTFLTTLKRSLVALKGPQALSFTHAEILEFFQSRKTDALKNPLGCGEGLRSLSYPQDVLRSLEVPQSLRADPEFLKFIPYLPPRFLLTSPVDPSSSRWQICTLNACEHTGTGLKDLIEVLAPGFSDKIGVEQSLT